MSIESEKVISRARRHKRIRNKVLGNPERPRLNVFRSSKHIYCQIIDDTKGATVVSASTFDKDTNTVVSTAKKKTEKGQKPDGKKIEAAKSVGVAIAKKAIEKGIKKVVFDRGGYLYHGRVKALADAAREAGLEF